MNAVLKPKCAQDSSCIQHIEEKQISTLEKFLQPPQVVIGVFSCGVTRHPEDLSTLVKCEEMLGEHLKVWMLKM